MSSEQQQNIYTSSVELASTEGMPFLQDDATFYQKETKQNGNFKTSFYNPFEIKHRRRTSRAQFKVLEKTFLENPKPNASVRRWLAQQLVMTPRGVQVWFQNRRAKEKSNNAKKLPSSEPLVKQASTSSYESGGEGTPLSSPSMCACPDCFATPMTRTMSYTEEIPFDFFMNSPRKFISNEWLANSPSWNFGEDMCFQPPMMRRMYTTPIMFDNRRYSQQSLDTKSIQSTELFRKLSEPIYNSFQLMSKSNHFNTL